MAPQFSLGLLLWSEVNDFRRAGLLRMKPHENEYDVTRVVSVHTGPEWECRPYSGSVYTYWEGRR